MASPPPYPSSFLELTGVLLAAPLRERDGSKTDDSFPFEDRDDKQKEAIMEIGQVIDVVQEKAAQHSQTPLEKPDNGNTYITKVNDWLGTTFMIHFSPRPQDPFLWYNTRQAIASAYACANRIVNWSCAPGNGGSPGPQQWEFIDDLVDMDNLKLLPKHTKDFLADTFTQERVGTELPRLLAALEYAPRARGRRTANTGGAAVPFLLDSGASMNAVGDARIMQGIQFFSTDKWVTIPDGSSLRIFGIGTIKMDGFSIPNVYLVGGLRKNLISVSQLDKDHGMCCCFHGGKCEIMLADGTVVGGAILQDDGMYKLYFLEVPEPEM